MTHKSLTRAAKLVGNALAFALALAVVVMILPSSARSQLGLDPCCAIISVGLSTISNLLSGVVAKPLGAIQQLEQQSANFEQQVVFPVTAINQARGLATQAQAQFVQMRQVFQLASIERHAAYVATTGKEPVVAQSRRRAPGHQQLCRTVRLRDAGDGRLATGP